MKATKNPKNTKQSGGKTANIASRLLRYHRDGEIFIINNDGGHGPALVRFPFRVDELKALAASVVAQADGPSAGRKGSR